MSSTPPGPKPIGGHYHTVDPSYESPLDADGSNHIFVPSSPMTRGLRFPLDFLPGGTNGAWEIADSRGSLILLYRGVQLPNMLNEQTAAGSRHNPGFLVCDPLTRQYKAVPCRPEEMDGHQFLGLFLLHGDQTNQPAAGAGGGHISLSNFRVMAALHRTHSCSSGHGVPVAYVFSMGSEVEGAWSSVFSLGSDWHLVKKAWSSEEEAINIPITVKSFYFAGRAYGSIYWGIEGTGTALVLDEATAGFSTFTLPEIMLGSYERFSFRVISRQDGALRVVRLIDNDLKVFVRIHGHGNHEWAVEGLVRLREATRGLPGREDGYFQDEAVIVDAHDTYVLLTPREKQWLFSIVLDTMEVDCGHERNKYAGPAYPWELPTTLWSSIFRPLP